MSTGSSKILARGHTADEIVSHALVIWSLALGANLAVVLARGSSFGSIEHGRGIPRESTRGRLKHEAPCAGNQH